MLGKILSVTAARPRGEIRYGYWHIDRRSDYAKPRAAHEIESARDAVLPVSLVLSAVTAHRVQVCFFQMQRAVAETLFPVKL